MKHGGDIAGFQAEYGCRPIDFSVSLSPLGIPRAVEAAVFASLDRAHEYPDPHCRRLTSALGNMLNLPPEMVVCGNGSADLIERLVVAKRPRRALVTAPTYGGFEEALARYGGCQVDHYLLHAESGFRVLADIIDAVHFSTDLVFICQPNSPTGVTVPRPILELLLKRCEEVGATLVIDECFAALTDNPSALYISHLIEEHPALLILHSFTKLFGMAGIRLGYAFSSDTELIAAVSTAGQPWPVSTVAQEAGLAALGCDSYVREFRTLVKRERTFLSVELAKLGVRTLGEANYLFFDFNDDGKFGRFMRECGLLVRDCSDFQGLRPGYYRVAVREHGDNIVLLAGVEEYQIRRRNFGFFSEDHLSEGDSA